MKRRTKIAIATILLAIVVAPPVALVPEWGVAPGPTGFHWKGTVEPYGLNEEIVMAGGGVHWERLNPIPGANPPIVFKWEPSIGTLMETIAQPNNVYMSCTTHGGPDSLDTPGPWGLYTPDILEAMQGREEFRLVMLYACSSADGGLCDAFTKGLRPNTVCIACTDPFHGRKVYPRFEMFVDLVSDPANQNRTLYELYEEIKVGVTNTTSTQGDDPFFYGDRSMTPADIFAIFLGDVNNDWRRDSADLQLIAQHIVGTFTLTGDRFVSADMDENSWVDVRDMQLVAQYIVGTI